MMMDHLSTHTHSWCSRRSCHAGSRNWRSTWRSRGRHVRTMLDLILLSVVDLCHSPDSSASKTGILVAVSPAINRTLDQATLATKAGVQLRQSPSDRVALALIMKTIALVLIFGAASTRVNAVFGLELLRKTADVDGFDIAADGVLHLDAVSGVLESDPLNTILVLPDDKWRGSWDRTGRGIGVYTRTCWMTMVNTLCTTRRARGCCGSWAHTSTLSRNLSLWQFIAWTTSELWCHWMRRVLRHRLSWLLVHECAWHRPSWLNWVLTIW
jgi:hypothetical protein